MSVYKEDVEKGNLYRNQYIDGIQDLIYRKRITADMQRKEFLKDILEQPNEYRSQFIEILGWPLTEKSNHNIPKSKMTFVAKDDNATIYRLQIEVFEDFYYYGLLFVKDETKKRPLVISQHGGEGTPELCSGLLADGSANYNDMTQRILKYDVNVFAPQMLLWNKQVYPIDYDRHQIDIQLKQLGGSITALEIHCLIRSLDCLTSLDFVAQEKIGMVGLSYGGFYTLFTTAIEERIKSCISCSFFNDRTVYDWIDWTWFDAANKFMDSEIAMLIYPRKLCIQIGENDASFNVLSALKEYERLKEYNKNTKYEKDWLRFMTFDGTHEFCKDDKPIERLINDIC